MLSVVNDLCNITRCTSKEFIYKDLLITLLLGKILDRHLQLVERVLHIEQVVQIEWEVYSSLLLHIPITVVRISLCHLGDT